MYQELARKEVVARKPHRCGWCHGVIQKGEKYDWSKYIFDGDFHEWRSHLSCMRVAMAIWDYVDPDEGMSDDEFMYGCQDVCGTFVCPDCEDFDKEYGDCKLDETYCIDKLDAFLQTHELYRDGRYGFTHIWKCRERQDRKC